MFPHHIRFWKCSTEKISAHSYKTDTLVTLKVTQTSTCFVLHYVIQWHSSFFLCPSRSAGPVTKLAHLFLSALFKKAAVSRKSCTFQMLLAWNGPLIIVVLHALLVPLFLSPFSFFFARNYRDNRNWELRKSRRNVKLWMPSYISSVSKWGLGCKFFLHYFTNHLTPMTALGPSVFIWKSIL